MTTALSKLALIVIVCGGISLWTQPETFWQKLFLLVFNVFVACMIAAAVGKKK